MTTRILTTKLPGEAGGEIAGTFRAKRLARAYRTEWWVPAEKLEELNDNIVGIIEVIGEYRR